MDASGRVGLDAGLDQPLSVDVLVLERDQIRRIQTRVQTKSQDGPAEIVTSLPEATDLVWGVDVLRTRSVGRGLKSSRDRNRGKETLVGEVAKPAAEEVSGASEASVTPSLGQHDQHFAEVFGNQILDVLVRENRLDLVDQVVEFLMGGLTNDLHPQPEVLVATKRCEPF